MKKRVKRLWVEGFRIPYSKDNKIIADQMKEWKDERERPRHFVRAMKLYISLLSGDLDTFYETLAEFDPRLAVRMMRQTQPAFIEQPIAAPKPATPKPKPIAPAPVIIESAVSTADALADSLGLDDIEF